MIKLVDILSEVQQENAVDDFLGDLANELPNKIKDDLEDASEKNPNTQTEVIGLLSGTAIALAVPGIVNTVMKVVDVIRKKSGFNLSKKKDPAWLTLIQQVSQKIDDKLATPFNYVLKPFITDETKRKKVSNVLKACVLVGMSLAGGFDPNTIPNVKSAVTDLAGEFGGELLQKSLPDLTKSMKTILTNVLK